MYTIVCPIEVALNRAARYFPCFEADWGTPVRFTFLEGDHRRPNQAAFLFQLRRSKFDDIKWLGKFGAYTGLKYC